MNKFWNNLTDVVPSNLIGAIILLIIGWIVARILGSIATRALRRTHLDDRIGRWMGRSDSEAGPDSAEVGGKVVYFIVLLFVLISVFDLLRMPLMTAPLSDLLSNIFGYIPRLLGAAILFLLAWVLASILKTIVFQLLQSVNVDQRLRHMQGQATTAASEPTIARALAEIVFALVLLFFLPAILTALNLPGLLQPVLSLFNKIFAFIPNLIAAALIVVIGWFIARFVAQLVTNLLAAVGADRFSERVGINSALGSRKLSGTIGLLVFILIIIPVIIAGLNALQLSSITAPASHMLDNLLLFIPKALGAAAIVVIAYIVGKIVSELITNILEGTAYDSLPARLGIGGQLQNGGEGGTGAATAGQSQWSLAHTTGRVILAAILWFAIIAALETLQLTTVSRLLTDLLALAGHILLGLIIFVVGLLIARFAGRAIRSSAIDQAGLASVAAQAAIMVLFGAMALRQMGVANDIINLAFGILLGAIGIAIAVAFGVGGRDVAGGQLQKWVNAAQPNSTSGSESGSTQQ